MPFVTTVGKLLFDSEIFEFYTNRCLLELTETASTLCAGLVRVTVLVYKVAVPRVHCVYANFF